jgi:Zn-dependent M32 family carboxypeptidase
MRDCDEQLLTEAVRNAQEDRDAVLSESGPASRTSDLNAVFKSLCREIMRIVRQSKDTNRRLKKNRNRNQKRAELRGL